MDYYTGALGFGDRVLAQQRGFGDFLDHDAIIVDNIATVGSAGDTLYIAEPSWPAGTRELYYLQVLRQIHQRCGMVFSIIHLGAAPALLGPQQRPAFIHSVQRTHTIYQSPTVHMSASSSGEGSIGLTLTAHATKTKKLLSSHVLNVAPQAWEWRPLSKATLGTLLPG